MSLKEIVEYILSRGGDGESYIIISERIDDNTDSEIHIDKDMIFVDPGGTVHIRIA